MARDTGVYRTDYKIGVDDATDKLTPRIAELEAALGSLWDVATTVELSGEIGCFVPEAEWRRAMSAHPAFAGGQSEGHPAPIQTTNRQAARLSQRACRRMGRSVPRVSRSHGVDWNKHYAASNFVGCNPVEVGKAAKARIAELERFAQWALATAYGGHDAQLALSRVADEARKVLATKPST